MAGSRVASNKFQLSRKVCFIPIVILSLSKYFNTAAVIRADTTPAIYAGILYRSVGGNTATSSRKYL